MRDVDDEPQFQKTRPRSARIWRRKHQSTRDMERSSCRGKRRFKDTQQAQRFVRGIKRGMDASGAGNKFDPQRVYRCVFCKGFHTSGRVDRME